MIETEGDAIETYLDAALALQGLTIEPAWRAGIVGHFRAIEGAARLFLAVPLADDVEAAPVFTP